MTNLADFGGGVEPQRDDRERDHDDRTDRARHRRQLYEHGRCRHLSLSKGTRCGGGITRDADGPFCPYHRRENNPVTIDDAPGLVARWAGTRPTTWEEIPDPCREALLAVDDGAEEVSRR